MTLAGLAFIIAGALGLILIGLILMLAGFAAGTLPKEPTDEDFKQAAYGMVRVMKRKREFAILGGLFIGAVLVGLFGLIVGA